MCSRNEPKTLPRELRDHALGFGSVFSGPLAY
jgi:hypothetical protein